MTDAERLIERAAELHQAGQLDGAARIYKEILARSPQDFDATHLLGVIALQRGQLDVAQRLITKALGFRPTDAAAAGNLGTSYLRDGQVESALQWFELAARLEPQSLVALVNVGEAMYQLGRYDSAVPLLQKACIADPASYQAHSLLGACYLKAGDSRLALSVFEVAANLRPDDGDAWANLSLACGLVGRHDLARQYAERAHQLQPDSANALNALEHAPVEQGLVDEAADSYRRGVARGSASVDMLLAFANSLIANGMTAEALMQLERAHALDENNLSVRWALALGRLSAIYESDADVRSSRIALEKALSELASWYESATGIDAPYKAVGTIQPFMLAYQNHNNRDLLMRYGALCASFMSTLPRRAGSDARPATPSRKVRLGVVSAHIREHSVWIAITKGWLEQLDRDRFEIWIFHLDPTVDRETETAMTWASRFDNSSKTPAEWAESIASSQLDIILYPEIGSDPLTAKLASMRLAPIQAVTWGHPETSGLPTIDFFISAQSLDPGLSASDNYSEQLIILPNLGVYVEPLELPQADVDIRALGLPADRLLLICPGSPFKYAPEYDDVWVEIAKGMVKRGLFRKASIGHLVFFRSQNSHWDKILEKRLRSAFAREHVDFDAHVSIIPFLDHAIFFALLRRSTLMLDTLGFSGFNTALQGIECGAPVLAFEGPYLRGRLASCLMRELELPDLVATCSREFIEKAVSLVRQPDRLAELRNRMIERRGRLFRNLAPVRELERQLLDVYLARCTA